MRIKLSESVTIVVKGEYSAIIIEGKTYDNGGKHV